MIAFRVFRCGAAYTSDNLAKSQQACTVQAFALCDSTRECSLGYLIETRAAVLPAFPGF